MNQTRVSARLNKEYPMRFCPQFLVVLTALAAAPASAKWAVSADAGAAYVMPTGIEGTPYTVGPNLNLGIGYQMKDALRLEIAIALGVSGEGSEARPKGLQGLRPSAKLFPFGGSMYGRASLPIYLNGSKSLGVLVGGGYELKLLGIVGGFVELNTGYEMGERAEVPLEMRVGTLFVW
jgi:hypothetical protein